MNIKAILGIAIFAIWFALVLIFKIREIKHLKDLCTTPIEGVCKKYKKMGIFKKIPIYNIEVDGKAEVWVDESAKASLIPFKPKLNHTTTLYMNPSEQKTRLKYYTKYTMYNKIVGLSETVFCILLYIGLLIFIIF